MRFTTSLILLALTGSKAVQAGLDSHSTAYSSGSGILRRVHHVALRHSAGLAKDLRIAFSGLVASTPPARKLARRSGGGKHTQCVPNVGSGVSGPSPNANATGAGQSSGSGPSATSSNPRGTATSSSSKGAASASPTSTFKIAQSYAGNDFWSQWSFFTAPDPTGGTVTYVDVNTAQSEGLVSVTSNGSAIMKVDTTPVVTGGRKTVRIQSQYVFTGGLILLDATHMPTGCGTWPAFWTNGPNWPTTGEIDIVEGVNAYTQNQATIHTGPGCSLSSSGLSSQITGSLVGITDCDASASNNEGCGIRDNSDNSFGPGFNANGGGVYAMLWQDSGISVWFFPRGSIPSDVNAGAPTPDSWGTPMAFWSASSCNPSQFFTDHSAIFDTTLCGQWAGGVWTTPNTAGQSQSCAAITGASTCSDYVLNNGAAFSEAYWEVNYVKIFNEN